MIIAALWLTILGNTTPYLWNHCDFYMDPYWLGWTFEPSLCGRVLNAMETPWRNTLAGMMFWNCSFTCTTTVVIAAAFNAATLVAMRKQANK